MAGGVNLDDDDGITGINVTPLVDVMLVLLIIFLVASTYIVKETIEVDLPRAASGGETLDTTLSLVLDVNGDLFLNGEKTTEAQVAAACQAASAKGGDAQAIIAADKNARHGQVVRIIDLVKRNGVKKFAINIKPGDIENLEAPGESN